MRKLVIISILAMSMAPSVHAAVGCGDLAANYKQSGQSWTTYSMLIRSEMDARGYYEAFSMFNSSTTVGDVQDYFDVSDNAYCDITRGIIGSAGLGYGGTYDDLLSTFKGPAQSWSQYNAGIISEMTARGYSCTYVDVSTAKLSDLRPACGIGTDVVYDKTRGIAEGGGQFVGQ